MMVIRAEAGMWRCSPEDEQRSLAAVQRADQSCGGSPRGRGWQGDVRSCSREIVRWLPLNDFTISRLHDLQSTFPGLRIPFGSNTALIPRISSIATGPF